MNNQQTQYAERELKGLSFEEFKEKFSSLKETDKRKYLILFVAWGEITTKGTDRPISRKEVNKIFNNS